MNVIYRTATQADIDLLVSQRLSFIEVSKNTDNYNLLKDNCYLYFEKALANNTCDVFLAEDNGKCIGTGIVFYYNSVPSVLNVTGKNAYITSMYVNPEYRNKGIGTAILTKILEKAEDKGYKIIMLNASDMGRPMYEKMGFTDIQNGMLLQLKE